MSTQLRGTHQIEDFVGDHARNLSLKHVKFLAICGLLDSLKKDRLVQLTCDSVELDAACQMFEIGRLEAVAINGELCKKTRGRTSDDSTYAGLLRVCGRVVAKPNASSFTVESEVAELLMNRPGVKQRLARRLLNLDAAAQKNKHQLGFLFGEIGG